MLLHAGTRAIAPNVQLSTHLRELAPFGGRMIASKPRRRLEPSRGVTDCVGVDMSEVTPACARPTKKYPEGRTGTPAGYQAHRDAGESSCRACMDAQSAQSLARRHGLSEEEKAEFRAANAAAHKRWRERDPEAAKATKHRYIAKSRAAVHEAKKQPCVDCGIGYPYYVMEFDHLDAKTKHFNVGAGVTCASYERLIAEIAKCEVVCANCHAERTHQRKQARMGMTADAMD